MRRHRFDPFSALFGATFAAIGFVFLFGSNLSQVRDVVWPVVALIVGTTFVAWATMVAIHDRRLAIAEALVEPATEEERHDPDPDQA